MKKAGRNDPCPCGSGKKFKKCCETKMIGKKYLAQKLGQDSSLSGTVSKMNSFFQSAISQPVPPAQPQKTFKASLKPPKSGPQTPENTSEEKKEE